MMEYCRILFKESICPEHHSSVCFTVNSEYTEQLKLHLFLDSKVVSVISGILARPMLCSDHNPRFLLCCEHTSVYVLVTLPASPI